MSPANSTFSGLHIVDLATDAAIVLLFVAYEPVEQISNRLMNATGFLGDLGHLVFLFICLFGLAFIYVDLYFHWKPSLFKNLSQGLRRLAMFLVYSCALFLFCSLLATAFAFLIGPPMPTVSALLIAGEGILLGAAFGLDLKAMEDNPLQRRQGRKVIKQGESLGTILPYLLMTLALVFPAEYSLARLGSSAYSPAFPILGGIMAIVAAAFLGRKLEKTIRPILAVAKSSFAGRTAIMSFLAVLSVLSLGLLQSYLIRSIVQADVQVTEFGAIFLFGFIPMRVFRILFSTNAINAILGVITLTLYLLRESHAI